MDEHARATLAPLDAAPDVTARRDTLLAWGTSSAHLHDHGRDTRQEAHLRFGPRWKNLHEVTYGAGYAVARLELAPRFAGDLAQWPLHPALLDLATAAGLPLLPDSAGHDGLFVPLSYDSVRVYAPLPARLWSTVRPALSANADATTVEFDAVLTDDDERVLVEARGFLMRRTAPGEVAARLGGGAGLGAGETSGDSRLAAVVRAGIAPDEGWAALARVMQGPALAGVVVSSIDVAALRVVPAPIARPARPAAARRAPQAALGSTEKTIADMWADLLGVDDVGPDDDFFDLGGHSLIAVRLVARMEKTFAKKLRLATLFDARTVRSLAAVVEDRVAASQWVSLVPAQPAGHRPPVFCVHGIGGEVLAYAALAARLGTEQPFYGFRSPGHDGLSAPLTIEAQAAFYVDELLAFLPEGPYLICGYSHGGRVALEMAHRLKDLGKEVAFLGAIDVSPAESLARGWTYPLRWLGNLPLWFWYDGRRSNMRYNLDRVRRLLRQLSRQLQAWATDAQGTAARVEDAMNIAPLPEDIQNIFRLNFAAFKAYTPRPYDGPVTLFRAKGQPVFTSLQPDLGWAQVASGPITVRPVPGNHLSILWEPEVEELANELRAALLDTQTARSSSTT